MPKTKKDNSTSSDSDSGPDDRAPPSKKSKDLEKTEDGCNLGNSTWAVDKQIRIRVNEFKGHKLIDIRQYYEKDGKVLPGKKGISLSIIQWRKLLELANDVNQAIDEK